MRGRSRRWIVGFGTVAVVAALTVASAFVLSGRPPDDALKYRTEGGAIERGTTVVWLAAVAVCLLLTWREARWRGVSCAVVLLFMALRELDFHERFTHRHVTSTRFWLSSDSPLGAKIVAFIALLILAGTLCAYVVSTWRAFLRDLRRCEPYSITVLGALAFVCASLVLDKLVDFESLDTRREIFLSLFEESLELGVPILILLALFQWRRRLSPPFVRKA